MVVNDDFVGGKLESVDFTIDAQHLVGDNFVSGVNVHHFSGYLGSQILIKQIIFYIY